MRRGIKRIARLTVIGALTMVLALPAMAFPTDCSKGTGPGTAWSYCNSGYGDHRIRAKTGTNQGEWWYVYGTWRPPGQTSGTSEGSTHWDLYIQKTH